MSSWLLKWPLLEEPEPGVSMLEAGKEVRTEQWVSGPDVRAFFDGYLFDGPELCHELGLDASSTAAEIAIHGYRKWGDGLSDRLRGGFVLCVWDRHSSQLLIVRDPAGLHPCYYHRTDELFLVSSDISEILGAQATEPKINRAGVAEFMMVSFSEQQHGETLFEGVRRLPPGHLLTLSNRHSRVRRYWRPLPSTFSWADTEEIEKLPARLERAVGRCLSVGANSIALSGGFDSVSLAVLASELRGGHDPLRAVSLRFPPGPCDEGPIQSAVARALGMPLQMLRVEESLDGEDPVGSALAPSGSMPCPVFSPWQSMYTGLFRTAASAQRLDLLMGTGGDDMFIVDFAWGADCLRSLHLPALWRFYRSWQRTSPFGSVVVAREVLLKGALRPAVKTILAATVGRVAPELWDRIRAWRLEGRTLPSWISRSDRAFVDELIARKLVDPEQLHSGEGSYVRVMRRLTSRPLLMLELEQAFAWSRLLGGRFFYPYYDREVMELALRIHPEHLIAAGFAKTPLRQLVAERLPQVTLPTKKVDFGQILHAMLRTHLGPIWQSIGASLKIVEEGLVDPTEYGRLVADYLAGRNDRWRPVWFGLSTEIWLREHRLRSSPR